jgi:DNA repair protein RadC
MEELAPSDRPREKMERAGVQALGDNELLAVLIGHGTTGVSALHAANGVLTAAGGVHGVARLSRDELALLPGVGPVTGARIHAALELGRRTLMRASVGRPQFMTAREVALYLLPQYGAQPVERFGIVLLDARFRLIRVRLLSSGSRDRAPVHPRDVFREAALANASGIIAFHNHPSGDASPSEPDILMTRRLRTAGEIMGIDLIDHVILTDNHYCSIKETGLF